MTGGAIAGGVFRCAINLISHAYACQLPQNWRSQKPQRLLTPGFSNSGEAPAAAGDEVNRGVTGGAIAGGVAPYTPRRCAIKSPGPSDHPLCKQRGLCSSIIDHVKIENELAKPPSISKGVARVSVTGEAIAARRGSIPAHNYTPNKNPQPLAWPGAFVFA